MWRPTVTQQFLIFSYSSFLSDKVYFYSSSKVTLYLLKTHLMHVGINEDFKGPHSQGDVGGCSGDGEDIVESLLPHVMGVDGLHQIATGHGYHGSIHGELQLPRTQLRVGVHTGEPESEGGDKGEKSREERSEDTEFEGVRGARLVDVSYLVEFWYPKENT